MPEWFKKVDNEVIDNENQDIVDKINSLQDNIQENINDKQALHFLQNIDSQVPGYDIDLAKDWNKYRFIVNNETSLDIPLNINQISDIWDFLIVLLNKIDDVELEYDKSFWDYVNIQINNHYIWFDDSVLWSDEIKKIFWLSNPSTRRESKEQTFNANQKVRELFKFIQTIRNKKGS